jgi:hypothetical protein
MTNLDGIISKVGTINPKTGYYYSEKPLAGTYWNGTSGMTSVMGTTTSKTYTNQGSTVAYIMIRKDTSGYVKILADSKGNYDPKATGTSITSDLTYDNVKNDGAVLTGINSGGTYYIVPIDGGGFTVVHIVS